MRIQTLSIVAGSTSCNARCPFCVSKMTCANGVSTEQPDVNWRNFDKACRLAQLSGVSTAMITGKGEPTIYPYQVGAFLHTMKKYEFPLIELQTNGLLIAKRTAAGPVLDHHLKSWYKDGLGMVALSVVHYEDERNHEIYNPYESRYPNLTKTIKHLHEMGFSVRLSCVMVKGFIDSVETLKDMISYAKANSVEQLTFTPVNRTSGNRGDKYWKWAQANALDTRSLNCIRHYFHGGSKTTILMHLSHGATICDFDGQNVCLSECLNTGSQARHSELRNLIFFPDGHLRYDWQYSGAVLL